MIPFAYVTFVNDHPTYIDLMRTTIQSIKKFSRYPLILYYVTTQPTQHHPFATDDDQLIVRVLHNISLPNIYYYKPYVIKDALQQGLRGGYYIESDDVLTPLADDYLTQHIMGVQKIPLSPIHPDNVDIPAIDYVMAGCAERTQFYVHGHVLFTAECLAFITEWLDICLHSAGHSYRNADETVLNMMYWKKKCTRHYLPIIDPWYEKFYQPKNNHYRHTAVTFHGCKDPDVQRRLLADMLGPGRVI